MPISTFAAFCAVLTMAIIGTIYLVFSYRRKNGKSDIREARIGLVISSFVVPILVTTLFVAAAIIAQRFYQYMIPVGHRGGGVFIILITCVASAIVTLILLLPKIKYKWED